jgi:uncharacterized circularly permuted ATP-grasp superfamily protein
VAGQRGWIARPVAQLSAVLTGAVRELVPRHVDLRAVAVDDGDRVVVLPGPAGSRPVAERVSRVC